MTNAVRTLALLAAVFLSQMFSSQMFSSQSALAQISPNQAYPNKTIRMIVTFARAAPTDRDGRIIAQKVSESWGQQVVVENVAGGGGNIGLAAALRAPFGWLYDRHCQHGLYSQSQPLCEGAVRHQGFAPISLVAARPM